MFLSFIQLWFPANTVSNFIIQRKASICLAKSRWELLQAVSEGEGFHCDVLSLGLSTEEPFVYLVECHLEVSRWSPATAGVKQKTEYDSWIQNSLPPSSRMKPQCSKCLRPPQRLLENGESQCKSLRCDLPKRRPEAGYTRGRRKKVGKWGEGLECDLQRRHILHWRPSGRVRSHKHRLVREEELITARSGCDPF